ncbi:hypothetical protein ALC60_03906, partial [Trachymyrmex zeteki]
RPINFDNDAAHVSKRAAGSCVPVKRTTPAGRSVRALITPVSTKLQRHASVSSVGRSNNSAMRVIIVIITCKWESHREVYQRVIYALDQLAQARVVQVLDKGLLEKAQYVFSLDRHEWLEFPVLLGYVDIIPNANLHDVPIPSLN